MSFRRIPKFTKLFNAKNAFWIALIGGILLTLVVMLSQLDKDWTLNAQFHFFFNVIFNVILMYVVLMSGFAVIRSPMKTVWKYVVGIGGSLLITVILSVVAEWLHELVYTETRFADSDGVNIVRDVTVASIAIVITIMLFNFNRRHRLRVEREQLQNENLMMRYEVMERQMDPHFLFNSLNTLSGLIGTDDERAQLYLRQLASTYRYIMKNQRLVELEQELEFAKSYSEMMQTRYGDNIHFEYNIDSSKQHNYIIPLSLQILIENALKHNVVSERHPLTISIETTEAATLRVSNKMNPKQETVQGTGVGLANLNNRYKMLCRKDIVISAQEGFFSVDVPLLEPQKAAKLMNKLQSK